MTTSERSDLGALLGQVFPSVTFLGQSFHPRGYVRVLQWIGKRWHMPAVRIHQCRKVLRVPWEKLALHQPTTLPARGEPEVLVAVCTLSA
jgi:hypothetical protein